MLCADFVTHRVSWPERLDPEPGECSHCHGNGWLQGEDESAIVFAMDAHLQLKLGVSRCATAGCPGTKKVDGCELGFLRKKTKRIPELSGAVVIFSLVIYMAQILEFLHILPICMCIQEYLFAGPFRLSAANARFQALSFAIKQRLCPSTP